MSQILSESMPLKPDTSYAGRLNIIIEQQSQIFNLLEQQQRRLDEIDRMCSVIYDELTKGSLDKNLLLG
jgi:hypothetical protein